MMARRWRRSGSVKRSFDFHAQCPGQPSKPSRIALRPRLPRLPGGLERHAEVALGNFVFRGLQIGLFSKQEMGVAGVDSRFFPANNGKKGISFFSNE